MVLAFRTWEGVEQFSGASFVRAAACTGAL
jgi:hypothetical protein